MKKYIIILLGLLSPAIVFAQDDKALTEETVAKETIKGHIYFLASDELKGRETGTDEIDIAARYLATTFMRYGVAEVPGAEEGYFQPVPLYEVSRPGDYSISLGNEKLPAEDLALIEGSDLSVNTEVAIVKVDDEKAKKPENLKNRIVIAQEKAITKEEAESAGAIGLVVVVTSEQAVKQKARIKSYLASHGSVSFEKPDKGEAPFFHIMLYDEGKDYLKQIKKAKNVAVSIGKSKVKDVSSKNVVGMVEGTDPELKDEFVIYSAHYDHIGIGAPNAEGDSIYNGARDNAVGVVTVMSAAENIAKYPTKRSALFILFTGEEKGLRGSSYYTENPLIPLNQMVYCFNSDNGGYNDTSLTTIIGLNRTTVGQHIKDASDAFGLKAIDDPAGEQGLFDRSDNVNFARKGVPAPTFSLGFSAFDAEIGKYYHQAADNPDNMDYDYLEKFFKAYVLSCRLIANDPETPFWAEGDKYYEAGKELYKE